MAPKSILESVSGGSTLAHSRNGSSDTSSSAGDRSACSGSTAASSIAGLTSSSRTGTVLSEDNVDQHNKEIEEECNGWPLLAKLMERQPGFEAFSRFRELNIKNLLYYQVELSVLGDKLKEQELWDRSRRLPANEAEFWKYADKMCRLGSKSDAKCKQWELVVKLRACLRDYNDALLQYSRVSALPEPSGRNMDELVKWIGLADFCIGGRGKDAWGDPYEPPDGDPSLAKLCRDLATGILSIILFWKKGAPRTRSDLVVPHPGLKVDALAGWIVYDAVPWSGSFLRRVTGRARGREKDVESASTLKPGAAHIELEKGDRLSERKAGADLKLSNVNLLSQKTISKITSFVATVVACLLPTGAIAVLTTATTTLHVLLYIGSFTMLFSIGLMVLTNEISRVQIFTATAAFSAVLVVFVQIQPNSKEQ